MERKKLIIDFIRGLSELDKNLENKKDIRSHAEYLSFQFQNDGIQNYLNYWAKLAGKVYPTLPTFLDIGYYGICNLKELSMYLERRSLLDKHTHSTIAIDLFNKKISTLLPKAMSALDLMINLDSYLEEHALKCSLH